MGVIDIFKRHELMRDSAMAVGGLLVGIIASPAFEDWWDANQGINPVSLASLLQNNDIN